MGGSVVPGAPRTDVEPCRHRNGRCAAPGQGFGSQGNDTVSHSNVDALTGSPWFRNKAADEGGTALYRLYVDPDEQCGGSTVVGGAATVIPLAARQNACRERSRHDLPSLTSHISVEMQRAHP